MGLHREPSLGELAGETIRMRPELRAVTGAALLASIALFINLGCGDDEGIGDPCIPEQEFDPHFLDFDSNEVYAESKSFQCRTRLCLVNHFRGRVTCPYGQSADGVAPPGAEGACTVPGDSSTPITGARENDAYVDPKKKSTVRPQCRDRTADDAVYCSCRCADANGDRPSDQVFCDCPDGFVCEPLVRSIGRGNEGLTGSYCVKKSAQYDPASSCNQGDCDPITHQCD